MKPSSWLFLTAWLGAAASSFAQAPASPTKGMDPDLWKPQVDALVKPVIDAGLCPGLAVGVIADGKTRVWGYGATSSKDPRPPGADTQFEIASLTKLFTNLLFSDMVHRGRMGLNDRAQDYLPAGVRMPTKDGRDITLLMLSNHTSGLPVWPDDMGSFDGTDPNSDYSFGQLYAFLNRCRLARTPGTSFLYSCLGPSLLGDLVALRDGTTWTDHLEKGLLDPLGMKDTGVTWTPEELARAGEGFDGEAIPPPLWKYPTSLLPEGSLHSTLNDLFKLARAGLDPSSPVLGPIAFDDTARQLGWGDVVAHEGESGDGFNSSFCLDRPHHTALILWGRCNTDYVEKLADRIQRVMEGAPYSPVPLPAFAPVPPKDLKAYAGRYEVASSSDPDSLKYGTGISLSILKGRLEGSGPGWWMKRFTLFPLSDGSFYAKKNGSILVFTKDAQGTVMNFQASGEPSFTAVKEGGIKTGTDDGIPPPP